jgi:hypothetical protein
VTRPEKRSTTKDSPFFLKRDQKGRVTDPPYFSVGYHAGERWPARLGLLLRDLVIEVKQRAQ